MTNFRAAVAQLNSGENVAENLVACGKAIVAAKEQGAQVIFLPENFAFMGPEAARAELAENLDEAAGPIASFLSRSARQHSIAIVGGGMPERTADPKRPFNTSAVFDPAGNLIGRYRKVHLFDVDLSDGTKLCESASTTPGSETLVCPLGNVQFGISICYDVRFPELYRRLVHAGATALAVTAAFTLHTGRDHWEVLLRARAIESQCWVLAAAQWGRHSHDRLTYGRSMIIDPWGTVVAQASDGVGVVVADLNLVQLARIRASLPSLKHRRL